MAFIFLEELPSWRLAKAAPIILGGDFLTILAGHKQSKNQEIMTEL